MPQDLLEIALRNQEFADDCMANMEVSNTALAIIDRIMDFFGKDILEAKIEGPTGTREGFDVQWKLSAGRKG